MLPYVVGIVLSIGVALFARWVGFDRDRAFYPTVLIVIASYYVLFAAMSGSIQTVVLESAVMTPFVIAAVAGLLADPRPSRAADAAPQPSKQRPNILFVFSDDQRWDTIHAVGNPEIRTPNLDRLVESGFRFDNAYCMGAMVPAVCTPSRTHFFGRSYFSKMAASAAPSATGSRTSPPDMIPAGSGSR